MTSGSKRSPKPTTSRRTSRPSPASVTRRSHPRRPGTTSTPSAKPRNDHHVGIGGARDQWIGGKSRAEYRRPSSCALRLVPATWTSLALHKGPAARHGLHKALLHENVNCSPYGANCQAGLGGQIGDRRTLSGD